MKLKTNCTKHPLLVALGCLLLNFQAYAAIYDSQGSLFDTTTTDNYFDSEVGLELAQNRYAEIREHLTNKEFDKARKKINKLLKKSPREPMLYNSLGLLELMMKNPAAAEKNYRKSIEINNNYPAYLGLAKLAMLTKKFSEVEKNLIKAQKVTAKNFSAELYISAILGKWHVNQQEPEKFLSLANKLSKKYPYNEKVSLLLAGAQEASGKTSLAEATLKQIINDSPRNIKARLLLAGVIGRDLDRQDEVITVLDEIHEISPKKSQFIAIKARYLITQKMYVRALKTADKAKKLFPRLPLGYQIEGDTFRFQGQANKAIDSYKKAYQVYPNDKLARLTVMLMMAQHQEDKAVSWLEGLLKINKNNLVAQQQLGMVHGQQGDNQKAIKHYQKVLDKKPYDVVTLNNLAWIYSQQNDPRAVTLAKTAYQKAPQSAQVADTYGYVLVRSGEHQTGLNILLKALEMQPQSVEIQLHAAEAYLLLGRSERGISILDKIIRSTENNNLTEKAKALKNKYKL